MLVIPFSPRVWSGHRWRRYVYHRQHSAYIPLFELVHDASELTLVASPGERVYWDTLRGRHLGLLLEWDNGTAIVQCLVSGRKFAIRA